MFYAMSKYPEFWEERVNLFVALAPVIRLDHISHGLYYSLNLVREPLHKLTNHLHIYSILGGQDKGKS